MNANVRFVDWGRKMKFEWLSLVVVLYLSLMISGCTGHIENSQIDKQAASFDIRNGVIVASVTAPFAMHYHETVRFKYRQSGETDKNMGELTSGMQYKNFLIGIPACKEVELPGHCGRLFAITLPAGEYEIYHAEVVTRGVFQQLTPAVFTVSAGKVSYIGNIDANYCVGMASRHRGNILGADVTIKDEYVRDIELIREHYFALRNSVIEKALLDDHAWRWRVDWTNIFGNHVAPHDWGGCIKGR